MGREKKKCYLYKFILGITDQKVFDTIFTTKHNISQGQN